MIMIFLPFLDWVMLSIIAVTLGYIYLTWNNDYWRKRNVPFQSPTLLFGNYVDVVFARTTAAELMEELYKKMEDKPFVGYWRFRTPCLLVRDLELIKTVLLRDFSSFQGNAIKVDPDMDPLVSKNPFFLIGDKWKATRSLLTPTFTSGKLKPLFPLMEEVSNQLIDYLRTIGQQCGPDGIETKELGAKYSMEMVATCAFGIKANSFSDPNAPLRIMTSKVLEPGFLKNLEILLMNVVPAAGALLKISLMPKEVDRFIRKIVKDVIDYRQNNNVTRNDFLQSLIELKTKTLEDGKGYSDEDITGHAVTFLTDGFETSSIVLGFIWWELARHAHVQERLRAEAEEARRRGGGRLTFDTVAEMPYLEQVLLETLRLYPPVMLLEKLVTSATSLRAPGGGGAEVVLPQGTLVAVPVRALHRDPLFFSDPETFDPERFAPDRRDRIPKYAYLPFNEGPRMCLGMRFAQEIIKLAVVTTVLNFDIETTRKTPPRYIQDPTYFLACAKGGLWVNFVPREEK